ncbi:NGG1p interacting factor 3 [Testicularia cyperi]|uniref:NGG1p interacting factor 3 n=1 Tax=Testicularia cyperi TaxID=1882483 RepID=A0A317XKS0_9BASI|nr:NGG1p interacting factor 3 [Testicularia cyperi]
MSQANWRVTESVRANPILADTVEAMNRIAPLDLADTSFDNVGILLQAPRSPESIGKDEGVMLAIDLTTEVCDEILASPDNIKVAIVYHPIIFRGLKSITFADPQQTSLLRLAAAGVSVYCPHTSLDATLGGINDWLGLVVTEIEPLKEMTDKAALEAFSSNTHPAIVRSKNGSSNSLAGMGRLIEVEERVCFKDIVERVKANLDLPYVQGCMASDKPIRTIAVCAGSGSGVFSGTKADLYLTGELSHHEVLAYKAAGASVIVTNHSNTERKYLRDVLQHKLRHELGNKYRISVSQSDCDPLTVM